MVIRYLCRSTRGRNGKSLDPESGNSAKSTDVLEFWEELEVDFQRFYNLSEPMSLDYRRFLTLVKGLSYCEGSAFIYQVTADNRARDEALEKLAQAQGRTRPTQVEEQSPDYLKRLYNASNSRSSNTDSS